jgi:intein/homing endonuclease
MSIALDPMSANVKDKNVSDQYFGKSDVGNDYFRLDDDFIRSYDDKKPNFGFNGLGELVYYRTYSRIKPDGSKERFHDTVRRVVEGCYEIQRRHCQRLHIPWDQKRAQRSAQEMFIRIWDFKFTPPGRGLWMMGTPFMWERGSASLNNCGFVSTDDQIESDPAEPFCFLMDMSMLGVGVGFDTKGAGKIKINQPNPEVNNVYIVPDSREGWVDSVRQLIRSYTNAADAGSVEFNYSFIRPAGSTINGFGGKASGCSILIELHDLIRKHLDNKIGKTLSSVDITDLMNYIGRCVVAGNVRRTAEIAFGEADDLEYQSMKNYKYTLLPDEISKFEMVTGRLWGEALSKSKDNACPQGCLADFTETGIPAERLQPAIDTWNAMNYHRWASNYEYVSEQIAVNGEPGLIWLDNVRDYGRLIDGRQPGIDGRAMGSNPCFAGSNKLLTDSGYKSIESLWREQGELQFDGFDADMLGKYGSQNIINNNGVARATKIYLTSMEREVFRVKFSDGSYIDATDNHEFITLDRTVRRIGGRKKKVFYNEQRCKLSDLNIGAMVPLNQTVHYGTFHDPVYAELAGWCIGDGSLSPRYAGQTRAECTVYDEDATDVLPRLRGLMLQLFEQHSKSKQIQPEYSGWKRDFEGTSFDHDEIRIGSNVLGRLLAEDGVICGDKHNVPTRISNGTKSTICAFIRGLASADGYINLTKDSISVRIWQTKRELLEQCRLLLNQMGIASTVQFRREERILNMNDGHGGVKEYKCKRGYELIISGIKQVRRYLDDIGFIQEWKSAKTVEWLHNHQGSNNSDTGRYATVVSIESIGNQPVYCLTEPETNQVVVNGYQVGQCVEQSLESYELCCLVETFPANHTDADDYMRTLKFAYLYAKTVTLLPTHNPRTNQVTLRNRRIGLSQSGIIQAFAKFGRRAVLSDFCDAGYNEIRRWDAVYADWLCVQKSIKVTSVKPSGTVSLLVGATPGIHHPEAATYWRRVRLAKDSILVQILKDAGYHIEPTISDPERTVVVKFAVNDPRVRPVADVTIWEQMANAVDYQRYWADNQVSCTVKFKYSERPEIKRVLEAYEDQMKGISFLPASDHGYAQAPYEPCTPEEVEQYNANIKPADYTAYITEAVGSSYCDSDKCESA